MTDPAGRLRTRSALVSLLPGSSTPAAIGIADLFAPQLDEYAEIIVGPAKRVAGFMTRGEDARFTDRAQMAMEQLGMPEAALAHHRVLSHWFEHVRAFLKIEWQQNESGPPEPLVACYFRRRPSVDEVVTRLSHMGIGAAARELVVDVAGHLEKDSIHFVSAAFRPERTVHHKLYFSQWITPETRDKVTARIARVFQLFGMPEELEEHWRKNHERSMKRDDSTLFVSISFSSEGIVPSFKIDYPGMGAARAAMWLPENEQAQAISDAGDACALAGSDAVTYLGVRFAATSAFPTIKYYCDVP